MCHVLLTWAGPAFSTIAVTRPGKSPKWGVVPYINGVYLIYTLEPWLSMAGNKLLCQKKDGPRSYLSSWALPPETSRDNCHGQTSGERGFLVAWAWSTCVPAAVETCSSNGKLPAARDHPRRPQRAPCAGNEHKAKMTQAAVVGPRRSSLSIRYP